MVNANELIIEFQKLYNAIYMEDDISYDLEGIVDLFRENVEQTGEEFIRDLYTTFHEQDQSINRVDYVYGDSYIQYYLDTLRAKLIVHAEEIEQNFIDSKLENDIDLSRLELSSLSETVSRYFWKALRFIKSELDVFEQQVYLSATNQIADYNGKRAYKRWITILDDRTCPICQSMHGTELPVNEPFLVDGDIVDTQVGALTYDYLPTYVAFIHPYDRCTIEVYLG